LLLLWFSLPTNFYINIDIILLIIIIPAPIKTEIMINQINDRLLISIVLNNHIILSNMNNSFPKGLKSKINNI